MKKLNDLPSRRDKAGHLIKWAVFKCDRCKQEVERILSDGIKQQFCGCNKIRHGENHTRLHRIWDGIKQRILNPNNKAYKDYGGRGITICPEWIENYIVFRNWSLSNGYADNLEIDRKENDGNYEPSNCRWVYHEENMRNTRTNTVTLKTANEIRELDKTGKYTQKELARKYKVSISTISRIINKKQWKIG